MVIFTSGTTGGRPKGVRQHARDFREEYQRAWIGHNYISVSAYAPSWATDKRAFWMAPFCGGRVCFNFSKRSLFETAGASLGNMHCALGALGKSWHRHSTSPNTWRTSAFDKLKELRGMTSGIPRSAPHGPGTKLCDVRLASVSVGPTKGRSNFRASGGTTCDAAAACPNRIKKAEILSLMFSTFFFFLLEASEKKIQKDSFGTNLGMSILIQVHRKIATLQQRAFFSPSHFRLAFCFFSFFFTRVLLSSSSRVPSGTASSAVRSHWGPPRDPELIGRTQHPPAAAAATVLLYLLGCCWLTLIRHRRHELGPRQRRR